MKLNEIRQAVTNPNKEERMPRHEAVALLREHNYPNAKARRRQVFDWIREVNPTHTMDSIRSDFLNRRISKRTALVRLGRSEFIGSYYTVLKEWQAERRNNEDQTPTPNNLGVKKGAKGKREQQTA